MIMTSLTHATAIDAILGALTTSWNAVTPTYNNGVPATLLFESTARSLKPPVASPLLYGRAVIRHSTSKKVTLNNAAGTGRYRHVGILWVQIFVPFTDGSAWTVGQNIGDTIRQPFEGTTVGPATSPATINGVVFTSATLQDHSEDGTFVRLDLKVEFYWESIR